ncbi:acyloxyacyl hydrolase [Aquisalimonas sp.]|uniref:acyloxyacyl hydrolase n=1 Tax=Aquisalimonas sp. TaxID=1872621 RepID=UPI0025BC8320|nr:acyloxyacyl hydrolase [Aquisalimonas sp.]
MRHRSQAHWLLLASLFMITPATAPSAAEIGVRAGASLGDAGFNSQEIYWRTPLPGRLGDPRGWNATSRLELNAARLAAAGDSMVTAGGNVGVWAGSPRSPVGFGLGTGPTYISQTSLGGRDFGSNWQFTSWATAQLRVDRNLFIGYRVQHTSNAGLSSPNQGYNLQALEAHVRF